MDAIKVYVDVVASFGRDGRLLPLSLTWEDGRKYMIERVMGVQPAAALKAGGQGDRYSVRVQGQVKYLFFERDTSTGGYKIGRWFVERRTSNQKNQ